MKLGLKERLKVIKRDNKTVDFKEEKIALAIKKGFNSVSNNDYNEADVNNVFLAVIQEIEEDYKDKKMIKIETVQDMVEKQLLKGGYEDVYQSYTNYRERRKEARKLFTAHQNQLLKALESLTLKDAFEVDAKRENANIDGSSAMGTMLHYGSAISRELAKSYLIDYRFVKAHEEGRIHIHDMDFLPMGTTTCSQIDLNALFAKGFNTGHGSLRPPNDISVYAALTCIIMQANQNEQHGGQSIPAFDYYLAPGVMKTFKKQFKQALYDFLDITGFLTFINFEKVDNEIDKLKSLEFDLDIFKSYWKEEPQVKRLFEKAYQKSLQKTNRATFQAMEALIHNLNTMHSRAGAQVPFSSINLGTDTSPEGRMIIKNYLLATERGLGNGETAIWPTLIFKLKEGVNYNEGDSNYDLFQLACQVSSKRLFPNFSFIDAPYNLKYYKADDYNTEVVYMGCRSRVLANVANPDKEIVTSRGNLSFTTINLPRIALKHGLLNHKKADLDGFFKELNELLELVRDQLLERFEYQCRKKVCNFPFLLGQGIWLNAKTLKPHDRIKRILRNGTLGIGFFGLAECLKALINQHHGESKKAQELGLKIIKFMRDKCDQYAEEHKLNFTLLATPAEGLAGRFVNIDKTIYGIVEGITDREYYTNSFHIPVYFPISITDKIKLEGPYHALTNAGHITYVELDGDAAANLPAFEKIIRLMKEAGVGYGAINHPVDRDPECGYTGVINDVCPSCGRKETEDSKFERIRRVSGYLANLNERFNNAKKAEERDRLKHSWE